MKKILLLGLIGLMGSMAHGQFSEYGVKAGLGAATISDDLASKSPILAANLGGYINSVTGREMLLWNGGCHVHGQFSLPKILQLKADHPNAKILVHPECPAPIQKIADVIGSTAGLLKYSIENESTEFIVATESGILHEMQKACPQKTFIPAPPETTETVGCSCNECSFMKLNTLSKLYNTLKYEWPTVEVDPAISELAIRPINKMLEISKALKS